MQRYNENQTDARTFSEIWKSLTEEEREDIAVAVYSSRCCLSRQCLWNWGNGVRRPQGYPVREKLAQIVSKRLNIKVTAKTLFPAR